MDESLDDIGQALTEAKAMLDELAERLARRQARVDGAGFAGVLVAAAPVLLCKDCRFSELHVSEQQWICSHPTSRYQPPQSLVTGQVPEPYQLSCSSARGFDIDDQCGQSGRHWERR